MPDMNPQPEAEGEDIRSMLEAGFKEQEAAPEPSSEASPPEVADAPVAEESPTAAAGATIKDDHPTDPKRYADGTFKQTKAEAAAAKAAPATEIPSTDAAKASEQPGSTPAVAPPAGWTAAEKAEWSKLPPAIQTAVSRREAEISRGGQQWSEQKQRYEAVLSPVAQAASRYGMTAEQGLNALLAAQNRLETDPANAIRELARNHGIDLATLAGQPPADGSRENPQAPDISALVRQAVQPFLAPIQQRMQAEQIEKEQSTVNLVTDFASQPGHEHFDTVQTELMALIPTVKAANPHWTIDKVLQDAYDRAVYANPTTRQALSAAQQQAAEAKRIADAKARTTQARSAAVSLTGSPTGTNGAEIKGTIREELEAAFAARA